MKEIRITRLSNCSRPSTKPYLVAIIWKGSSQNNSHNDGIKLETICLWQIHWSSDKGLRSRASSFRLNSIRAQSPRCFQGFLFMRHVCEKPCRNIILCVAAISRQIRIKDVSLNQFVCCWFFFALAALRNHLLSKDLQVSTSAGVLVTDSSELQEFPFATFFFLVHNP